MFEVPLTQEDLETFDWCTWPTRSWYWESQTTLVRILVIRLFWLQYFCAKGPTPIRYWSFLAMDQHIPMILWCEKMGRAPSYMECVRDKIVPRYVQPLCEETLCVTEYGLQDLLEQDSKNDFFKVNLILVVIGKIFTSYSTVYWTPGCHQVVAQEVYLSRCRRTRFGANGIRRHGGADFQVDAPRKQPKRAMETGSRGSRSNLSGNTRGRGENRQENTEEPRARPLGICRGYHLQLPCLLPSYERHDGV